MRILNKRCPKCSGINNIYEFIDFLSAKAQPRAECKWCGWIGPSENLINDPPLEMRQTSPVPAEEQEEKSEPLNGKATNDFIRQREAAERTEPQVRGKVIYVCNKCDVAFTKGVVNERCPICGEPVECLTRIKIVRETPDGPNVRQMGHNDSVMKGLDNSIAELVIYTLLETPAVRATVAKTVVKVLGKFMKAGKMTL